jgi:endonuclease/exonuclease/phosphatase family metal-dependent hydrolase
MATPFRFASFNCENLFSRAKVLNLKDNSVAADALTKINQLDTLLRKQTYTAAVKSQIVALFNQVSTYIEIREDRGKLFSKGSTGLRVVAGGVNDWDGAIEFKRAKLSEMARENTAKVIKAVKADAACLVETESRPTVQAFNSDMLTSKKFDYVMVIDGNDPRGIDVGFVSNYKLDSIRTHVYDRDASGEIFSRDCLEIQVMLDNSQPLHVLCNHLKSQGYGVPAANNAKRKRQAVRIAEILQKYDLKTELIIVAGDFNDSPDSDPLQPLLTVEHLTDVLSVQFPDPAVRWTYHYRNKFQQIDYILVSDPLKNALQKAGIERRGMFQLSEITQGAETEFDTVTSYSDAASDHAAVWAEFSL